jgi:hypothetical protein
LAISVLALHELEEADVHGVVLPLDDRREASEIAGVGMAEGLAIPHEVLQRRTARLLRDMRVEVCVREVTAGVERPLHGAWLVAVAAGGAFALGFLTHQLGAGKVVNLLSIPLLGLVVWNLLIYGLWAVMELRAGWSGDPTARGGHGVLGAWFNRLLLRGAGVRVEAESIASAPGGAAAVVVVARRGFWEKWLRVMRLRAAVWVELAFHAGAVGLAIGLVAGMYARGVSAEYKAAWESTFLEAPAVSTVLRSTLGPASRVLHHPIPHGQAMQRLNIHDQEKLPPAQRESAAGWIHLYALTALLFIVLPRLALMALMWRRGRRIDTQAPVEPLLAAVHSLLVRQAGGQGAAVMILPFAAEPDPARLADLRLVMRRIWPDTGEVTVHSTLAYGEEDEGVESLDGSVASSVPQAPGAAPASRLVLLMSLSATPEREVHGQLVRTLDARSAGVRGDDQGVMAVVLDARAFRRQFEALPEAERRLRERRTAWEKIIEGAMEAAFSEDGDFFIWRRVASQR